MEILQYIYNEFNLNGASNITCIITDQFMNFMNGTDTIMIVNKLIEDKRIKKIPIIFQTAFLDGANMSLIKSVSPEFILNKPVNKQQLIEALKEIDILK